MVWKPVVGYEGLYEVSDRGDVRSLDRVIECSDGRTQRWAGKILAPGTSKSGYKIVSLRNGLHQKSCNVHRLVAEAFLPNPQEHVLVRHLDDNGLNNTVENLKWGSYSENRRDAVRSGAYVNQHHLKTECIRGHEFTVENTYVIPSGGRACRECRRQTDLKRRNND